MAQTNTNILSRKLVKTTKPNRPAKLRYSRAFMRGADELQGNYYAGPGHAGRHKEFSQNM